MQCELQWELNEMMNPRAQKDEEEKKTTQQMR